MAPTNQQAGGGAEVSGAGGNRSDRESGGGEIPSEVTFLFWGLSPAPFLLESCHRASNPPEAPSSSPTLCATSLCVSVSLEASWVHRLKRYRDILRRICWDSIVWRWGETTMVAPEEVGINDAIVSELGKMMYSLFRKHLPLHFWCSYSNAPM